MSLHPYIGDAPLLKYFYSNRTHLRWLYVTHANHQKDFTSLCLHPLVQWATGMNRKRGKLYLCKFTLTFDGKQNSSFQPHWMAGPLQVMKWSNVCQGVNLQTDQHGNYMHAWRQKTTNKDNPFKGHIGTHSHEPHPYVHDELKVFK